MDVERFRRIAERYIAELGPLTETFQQEIKVVLSADLKIRTRFDSRKTNKRIKVIAQILREDLGTEVKKIMKELDNCPSKKCEKRNLIFCECSKQGYK